MIFGKFIIKLNILGKKWWQTCIIFSMAKIKRRKMITLIKNIFSAIVLFGAIGYLIFLAMIIILGVFG